MNGVQRPKSGDFTNYECGFNHRINPVEAIADVKAPSSVKRMNDMFDSCEWPVTYHRENDGVMEEFGILKFTFPLQRADGKRYRFHLAVVQGDLKAEREPTSVIRCPILHEKVCGNRDTCRSAVICSHFSVMAFPLRGFAQSWHACLKTNFTSHIMADDLLKGSTCGHQV